jgi:hypothetical protein
MMYPGVSTARLGCALMAKTLTRAERKRQKIAAALAVDPSRSNRSIAAEVKVSHMTVGRVRVNMAGQLSTPDTPAGGPNGHVGMANLVKPPDGNALAEVHGAYREARRQPLEALHRERLRRDHPTESDDAINLRAKRSALIDLYWADVSDRGPVRGKGDATPSARELRLLLDAEERAAIAMEERRERVGNRAGYQTLADIEAELGEDDPDDVDGEAS